MTRLLRAASNRGYTLRKPLFALRRVPDRIFHARRHAAALANVRARARRSPILVVCHGNICRSPFAEAALRRRLDGTGIRVVSAGFIGPGRPSPQPAQEAAAACGVDLAQHRSQLLAPAVVRDAALVVTMDVDQARAIHATYGKPRHDVLMLGDLDPRGADSRTIRDPIDQPPDVYRDVYARIDRCVEALAAALTGSLGPPPGMPIAMSGGHDVPPLHG